MKIARGIFLSAAISSAALGQKTGALMKKTHPEWAGLTSAARDTLANRDTLFAMLLFDPSLIGFARASAWTMSVVPVGSSKEARIQANICDLSASFCRDSSAFAVTLAGPLNADDDFTKLADLNGLAGSARVEIEYATPSRIDHWFLGANATYSAPSFAYRDSATLSRRSVDRTAYAAEVGTGYRWTRTALLAALRVEQAYKARASQNICTPAAFGPAGTETCYSVVLAPPLHSPATVASATFAWSLGANAAAHLTVAHDLQHGVTGVDLPLWIVNDPKSGVGGGVRFGYTSEAKKLSVAFFVSTFKL